MKSVGTFIQRNWGKLLLLVLVASCIFAPNRTAAVLGHGMHYLAVNAFTFVTAFVGAVA